MAEILKDVFEDEKGNQHYLANNTETTFDQNGTPLNNGGDLSEASVNFTVSSSRKALTAKARFKALMGDIAKWLTDLGPAAFYKVADDFTTTAENYLFTARKGKQLKDEVDNLNQNLNGYQFRVNNGVPEYKAGADAAWVPFNKYLVLDNIRLSARYQGSGTFDVKPYISNYSKLNTENFYVGVKSFSSQDFNTAGVSVRKSYNSSTGILTISISGNTYDTPTYLIVIKQ